MNLKIDRKDLQKVWIQFQNVAMYADLKDLNDRTTKIVAHIEQKMHEYTLEYEKN